MAPMAAALDGPEAMDRPSVKHDHTALRLRYTRIGECSCEILSHSYWVSR